MITYIVLSYCFVFILACYEVAMSMTTLRRGVKCFILAPVTAPIIMIYMIFFEWLL